jgi:hypothetical protein
MNGMLVAREPILSRLGRSQSPRRNGCSPPPRWEMHHTGPYGYTTQPSIPPPLCVREVPPHAAEGGASEGKTAHLARRESPFERREKKRPKS